MYVTHHINMDLAQQAAMPSIDAMQADQYVRQIAFDLYSSGEVWEIPEDAHAVICYLKADGTGGEYNTTEEDVQAWTAEGNVLTVTLVPQVLSCAGPVMVTVDIWQGSGKISTFPVMLNVQKALSPELGSADYLKLSGFLRVPAAAEVGQFFRVAEVDEFGGVTRVEAVTLSEVSIDGAVVLGDIQQINVTGKLTTDASIIVNFNSSRLQGVKAPTADTDAANKAYVDQAIADALAQLSQG